MNVPLFLAVTVFILGLVFTLSNSNRSEKKQGIITTLIVSILSGVIANVISYAITYGWEPRETQPGFTIDQTEDKLSTKAMFDLPCPGDIIQFGTYPQNSSSSSPIEWIVLNSMDEKLLVISSNALDCQKYHSQDTDVTWETCSLRQWLNSTFYNAAFSGEEQKHILPTTVSAQYNPQYSTNPGSGTQDKLFLLSIDEVNLYFSSNNDRVCTATLHAVKQGAYENSSTGSSWWWLRTPGISNKDAASVNSAGSIDYDDGSVILSKGSVRPAMWIAWTDYLDVT